MALHTLPAHIARHSARWATVGCVPLLFWISGFLCGAFWRVWEHVWPFKGLVVRFRGCDVGSALASAHGNELGQAAKAVRHQSLRLNMGIEHEAPNKRFVSPTGYPETLALPLYSGLVS